MPSYDDGKSEVIKWILSRKPEKILDVGACDGKWAKLLREAGYEGEITACEIFRPNARQIMDKYGLYDWVLFCDVRTIHTFREWDLVIFGDVIEHMNTDDAYTALLKATYHIYISPDVVVGVPFQYKQGPIYGNPWEEHIQDDLTPEIFMKRYGDLGFELLAQPRPDYAYYICEASMNKEGKKKAKEEIHEEA